MTDFPIVKLYVTDYPVVKVHVDELSSALILQHKLFATLSANVNINYRLPIKVHYRICTIRHIRFEIIHGSQNVLSFNMGWWILVNFVRQPMLKIKTHSGFYDLFLKQRSTKFHIKLKIE